MCPLGQQRTHHNLMRDVCANVAHAAWASNINVDVVSCIVYLYVCVLCVTSLVYVFRARPSPHCAPRLSIIDILSELVTKTLSGELKIGSLLLLSPYAQQPQG